MASPLDKKTKEVVIEWCGLINREERYYFAKALDLFYDLPSEVQFQLLRFFTEEMDWKKYEVEEANYIDIMRGILHHYSGREDAGQPTRREFGRKLGEFLKSSFYREAGVMKEADDFMKELKSVGGTTHAT